MSRTVRTVWLSRIAGAMLAIVGVIHVLPVVGVAGAERLAALYGMPLADPTLVLLMRHRAVLFGLLGAFLFYAAARPSVRAEAFVAGAVSVGSFLLLAAGHDHTAAVGRVVTADVAALVCLAVGAAAHALWRRAAGRAREGVTAKA